MSKKTNMELVEYCKKQVGRPYWLGGFGQAANKATSGQTDLISRGVQDSTKSTVCPIGV